MRCLLMWTSRESNPGPSPCKGVALPIPCSVAHTFKELCRGGRTRTYDLLVPNQADYQLSYISIIKKAPRDYLEASYICVYLFYLIKISNIIASRVRASTPVFFSVPIMGCICLFCFIVTNVIHLLISPTKK